MDIIERLRKVDPDKEGERTRWYRNPDGPEAANEIESLRDQNAELVDTLKKTRRYLNNPLIFDYRIYELVDAAIAKATGGE